MGKEKIIQIKVGCQQVGIVGLEEALEEESNCLWIGTKQQREVRGMEIKVLGPGCAKCSQVEENVKKAVSEAGIEAKIEKVTDVMEIAKYGVFTTPGVVIDGKVKCVGKVPTVEEVKNWIL